MMTMMRSDAKREGEGGVREEKSQCLSFSVLIVFLFQCLNSCYLLTQLGIFSFVFLCRCSQIPWICMAGVREKYDME
ncbi:hypothetical protein CI102_2667 [Trichoderma harzianum]|nr:hypothetical protein CI102_2667 [Trichoderma harzianum]